MLGSLREFVSPAFFMAHGHCYLWKPALVWLQVLTNGFVGLSYFTITITLVVLVRRVRNIPFQWMYLSFGTFIIACGITHFFDILVIWEPVYWIDGAVRAITAVASLGTAVLLPTLLPRAKKLADAAELNREQSLQLAHANGELERARVELEARVSERTSALRQWERIFQHATWGVAVAGAKDVRLQAVNPAYARMHGYSVEELVGAPVSTLWAPEAKGDMERNLHQLYERDQLVTETVHLCKDGTRLPVEVVATKINGPGGEPERLVANVQDITERKRLQKARERALELEARNRRSEEANRLKSQFLANMSHELRTPLNSIIGFGELLHDGEVGALTPKQIEFLGDILAAGRHLLGLINDVLDLAKVEAGKTEFRPEPVDLGDLTGKLVQSLRAATADKQIEVEVSVDPTLTDVALDPGRFKQILYNYVSNALKFTPDGGRVVVRLTPEGADRFRVEVEDTGVGVAADNRQHLFVAFQQLDSSAAKRHPGTGLGLALTKQLTEAQGGEVGMRPAPSQGSVFFAVLPRRPPPQPVRTAGDDLPTNGSPS